MPEANRISPSQTPPPERADRPPRVLVVDKNPDVAITTGMLIEATGFDVNECCSGPEALAVVADFPPDICLIELSLSGMDGAELARWLRVQSAGRPLALLSITASDAVEARRQSELAGFDQHFVKPAEPDVLLAAITCAAARVLQGEGEEPDVIVMELEIPESATPEEAIRLATEAAEHADGIYRAVGGSGLKVDDVKIWSNTTSQSPAGGKP